jgi:hypothetical protein
MAVTTSALQVLAGATLGMLTAVALVAKSNQKDLE